MKAATQPVASPRPGRRAKRSRARLAGSDGLILVSAAAVLLLSLGMVPAQLEILNQILVGAILALSLNLLLGLAGQVSFGHVLFYGTGAYAVALATQAGQTWLLGVAAGLVMASVLGLLTGGAALRLSGHYLAMFTFAAGIAWYLVVKNVGFTGGINGKSVLDSQTELLGVNLSQPFPLAIACLVVLTATTLWYARVKRSDFGRLLVALKEDETLLTAAGVRVANLKLRVFVASAAVASLAGSLFALTALYVDPESFTYATSIDAVVMVMLGGIGTALGPWLGGLIFVGGDHLLAGWAELRLVLFGSLTVAVLLAFPTGLAGLIERAWVWVVRWRRRPEPAERAAFGAHGTPASARAGAAGDPGLAERVALGLELRRANHDVSGDLLVVSGLSRSYGGVRALSDVTFGARAGECMAVVGPNGAGKSTLFNCMSGWDRADEGRIELAERRLDSLPALQIARSGVARSFQTPRVIGSLTVRDNVCISALSSPSAARDRPLEMLEALGLGHRAHTEAAHLTHGERKRLELGRVLLEQPRMILLDEPFAGLAAPEIEACGRVMRAFTASGGLLVFIDHNLASVMRLADRVIVLDFGMVIADAPPERVRAMPEVAKAYQMVAKREEPTGA